MSNQKYNTKQGLFGTKYYDDKGKELGRASTSFLGERIIVDKEGKRVGRISKDWYGNDKIVMEKTSTSIFGTKRVTGSIFNSKNAPEDWELCDDCDEYHDDDEDCGL